MTYRTLIFTTLAAVAIATCTASLSQAQVIGTYRPSLVTYYPSASSVTPIAAYRPVPSATQYAASPYNNYGVQTASWAQPATTAPVVNTSFAGGGMYAGVPQYTASPVTGGDCGGCGSIQTIGAANYAPGLGCGGFAQQPAYAPIAYQQPIAAQYQAVPYQNIGGAEQLGGKYYVGKGLLGRPKVYAQGQPVRNALRSILP